jgi:hypothetical protein
LGQLSVGLDPPITKALKLNHRIHKRASQMRDVLQNKTR